MLRLKHSGLFSSILTWATENRSDSVVVDLRRKIAKNLMGIARLLKYDPPCLIEVAGVAQKMLVPLSHRMPEYRVRFSWYDRCLTRLSEFIRSNSIRVGLIDVGANIGDTILSCNLMPSERCIAIEPHPDFIHYLRSNVSQSPNCEVWEVGCSAARKEITIAAQVGGTARLGVGTIESTRNHTVKLMPLDDIVAAVREPTEFNLLKIDTDGHDLEVLIGASNYLQAVRPWILYECDIHLTSNGRIRHAEIRKNFEKWGYRKALFYKNTGELFKCVEISDEVCWVSLIEDLGTGSPAYYDILILSTNLEGEKFAEAEQLLFSVGDHERRP